MDEIKSKEDFINHFADKIWDRASLVNPETGRFEDQFTPILAALYIVRRASDASESQPGA